MNNLWEQSNIQANCDLCGVDEPFYMPVERGDMMALRFQLPYYLVNQNAGGLPIASSLRMYMVDETGTNVLCDMGNGTNNKFMYGYYNDTVNDKAQYQFYMPVPFKDEAGYNYRHAFFDVNVGQRVKITGANTGADVEFTYGVDETPAVFQEIRPNRLVFPYRVPGFMLLVYLDNVSISYGVPYAASTCAHENFNCFRVRLDVYFSVPNITKTFYTKPFKVLRTCDDSVMLNGVYGASAVDCNGNIHNGTFVPAVANPNNLFLRVPAVISRQASRVKKTYNEKCFAVRGERQSAYRLNSTPVPDWFASEAENVILANKFRVNNVELQTDDTDQLFTGVDIPGYTYQYLDLPLSSCKCLLLYGC